VIVKTIAIFTCQIAYVGDVEFYFVFKCVFQRNSAWSVFSD